ncbi:MULTISPECIES: DoxX family protein [Salinivibrio]|uniref:DoxX family protein n=1 Tax=Salinivibrio TaxID=51366 RepID=UPI000E30D283|nr:MULTISPECIES: DoxX family protein [Salinivibrio]WBA11587.1 DoxX family protein [Salinivibrio kushneri]WBA17843.1 DoxX family protein [Salinivibrio kushneri]
MWLTTINHTFTRALTPLQPLLLLVGRVYVAWIFFQSGLIKYQNWDSTLYLFEFEYQVPLLPWQLAAYLGTAAELILPVFVALGLLARPMTLALFVFNIVAVASYPLLWERGYDDHIMWGVILLVVSVWGPGWFNLDNWLARKKSGSD